MHEVYLLSWDCCEHCGEEEMKSCLPGLCSIAKAYLIRHSHETIKLKVSPRAVIVLCPALGRECPLGRPT